MVLIETYKTKVEKILLDTSREKPFQEFAIKCITN